jgi:subtilase family serine protease
MKLEILETRWLFSGYFTPTSLRSLYGINSLAYGATAANGAGQTIAIVTAYDDPNIAYDLQQFDAAFSLSNPTFNVIAGDGSGTLPPADTSGKWELETALDVEWAHVVAPGASILLVEAASNSILDLAIAAQYAATRPGVSVVSMSFGSPLSGIELSASDEAILDTYFTQPAGHNGVTFVAASGDDNLGPYYPAISPNVIAVGGTEVPNASATTWTSETTWSNTGGGVSAHEPGPLWQAPFHTGNRAIPDVSMPAQAAFQVYNSYTDPTHPFYLGVDGTSAAAPLWAGLIAIINQGRSLAGLGSLTSPQALEKIYSLNASNFHDITTGSNGVYSAASGYDLVTGRGSPIANNLVVGMTNMIPIGAVTSVTSATISGWAYDPDLFTGADTLALTIDGVYRGLVAANTASTSNGTFISGRYIDGSAHGFSINLAPFNLSLGSHTVSLTLGDSGYNAAPQLLYSGTVVNHASTGVFNGFANQTAYGWAYDPDAGANPINVTLYVDGSFKAAGLANVYAGTSGIVFGGVTVSGDYHGFAINLAGLGLASGTHTVAIYAIDANGTAGITLLGTHSLTNSYAAFAGVVAPPTGTFISGFARDDDLPTTAVYVDLTIGSTTVTILANQSNFTYSGHNIGFTYDFASWGLASGSYNLFMFAHDAVTGDLGPPTIETIVVP